MQTPVMTDSRKSFGLLTTTSLVVGTMIGSGIFLLPASLAPFGNISFIGWLIASLGAISLAWVFSTLSKWIPGQGGPFHYAHLGFGDFAAFIVAWGYWVSIWTGNAAVATAAVSYLNSLLPSGYLNEHSLLLSLIFLWVLTWVNCKSIREAGALHLALTILKTLPLFIFIFVGLFFIDTSHYQWLSHSQLEENGVNDTTILTLVITTVSLCLWAFIGVESATIPNNHIRNPKTTIPKATLLGVALVALIYIAGFAVITGLLTPDELLHSSAPYADASEKIGGLPARLLMGIIAIISTLGALNGLILLGGQVASSAANKGLFPSPFSSTNKNQSPQVALITSSILTSFLLIANYSDDLTSVFTFSILLSTSAILVAYGLCSLVALKYQWGETQSRHKFLSSTVIIFAFLFSMWATIGTGRDALMSGLILMLLGLPLYFWLKKNKS